LDISDTKFQAEPVAPGVVRYTLLNAEGQPIGGGTLAFADWDKP
jgi:hypothetical protein